MASVGVAPAAAQTPRPQRPDLTADQKRHIVRAAMELVRATAEGRASVLPDPTLAGAANRTVSGVFVSLKRRGHLRSCCGMLGQPLPLVRALHEAAVRTAWEDHRFPPVSTIELAYLDLEVWVLYNPEPVQVQGRARVEAVTVGRHGLQIVRGQSRGLLLPGVAVEHQWDAERFLNQVCIKAGLPPTAWHDDGTTLFTFEGEALRGHLGEEANGPAPRLPALVRHEELRAYVDYCRGNLWACLTGATPTPYLLGVSDGHVNGVILSLRRQGSTDGLHLTQLSLRPGVPLQATLFTLTQTAAQTLAAQRIRESDFHALDIAVTVLHDPALHGSVDDHDLGGFEPDWRAALVLERGKAGIVFDPQRPAKDLLAEAAREAQVNNSRNAGVYSMGVVTSEPRLAVSTVPRPVRGPAVRPPGVAGVFYPGEATALAQMVDSLLTARPRLEPWPAAMVPHAGLSYSGRIAAGVLQRIQFPSTVIVLGPKHTPYGVEWAVAPHQTWALPGLQVESDFLLARQLCEAIPGLQMDAAAHQREHAIEVELPLLARLAPQSRVVGIVVGSGDLDSCRRFADGLTEVLRAQKERPLLLISSDMNHFATDAENRRLDEIALSALEQLDPATLYETVTGHQISMCGLLPAVIVLETLQRLGGLNRAERAGYATSADVTGDRSRVVGYAGMLFR